MAGAHALYALAWISFGLGHSILASESVKARMAFLGRAYRLAFNVVALVHLAAVLAIGRHLLAVAPAFDLPVWAAAGLWSIHAAGWVVILVSARSYDLGRFSGLAQLRGSDENEPLHLDGPHRWVRHPLYSGTAMVLWGAAQTPWGLATAIWGSLYLLIGTVFEERKLLRLYDGSYADYRRRVPAVIPWKGRAI